MTAIVDYGCGNLFSISRSLEKLGISCTITGDRDIIASADKIILPGVGAFEDAAKKLEESGLGDFLKELAAQGKYILGICLGMQLLFEKSYEYGCHNGLGLIKGSIVSFEGKIDRSLKIPHMGWNKLSKVKDDPILRYAGENDYVYFVHSYYGTDCDSNIICTAEYDVAVPAIVRENNVYGMQFHPEKSGDRGLLLLKAFCEM